METGSDRDPRGPSEPARNAGGSFDGLFSARRVPMVRLATLLVGSPAIAEEVVQDAFVAVSERWDTVDRPDAYLRRSVINGCAGILRRRTIEQRYRAARLEVADDEIPEQLIDLRTALD
ncbi:MAG: hypothetical protein F4072_08685, partial [Acidimicrobiaceae bacterium]|nr:hypothetical protein [Acidimicrobiaceae bacterium]